MNAGSRIPVGGAELAYDAVGSGQSLILVHGTGADASTWQSIVGNLATHHRVIAYDRRGYGRSTYRPVRAYRVHVGDLAAVVEHIGAPAHVLGWSSGGTTALALAAARPELFRSLIIVEAPFHGLRRPTGVLTAIANAKLAQLRGRPDEGAATMYRWLTGLRDGSNGFDALPVPDRDRLLAHSRVTLAELDPHPFGALAEHVPVRKIAALPMPVTWLLGTESIPWFARLHACVIAVAPHIRTEYIVGAGHLTHIEAPEAFADAVHRAIRMVDEPELGSPT
ncbi:MAG: alpha/beta hydrolase [Pseudonocardiaceae bacterium]